MDKDFVDVKDDDDVAVVPAPKKKKQPKAKRKLVQVNQKRLRANFIIGTGRKRNL